MREFDEILTALESSEAAVLATVVRVRGSTYRREGARLVIPPEGDLTGNISGGCLEGELVSAAADVRSSGRARLLQFDLTSDDLTWGRGLGCNGVIEVLLEPSASALRFAAILRKARRDDQVLAVITVISGERIGERLFVHPGGGTEGTLGADAVDRAAMDKVLEVIRAGGSARLPVVPDGIDAFAEVIQPPLRLVVCGAGQDAVPLVRIASFLGWRVDVVDDRPALLTTERFPQARRLLQALPAQAAAAVAADERTYVVVMTHKLVRDVDYLRSFLVRPLAYLGVLGPAARLERILEGVPADGVLPTSRMDCIHGPAGLDLGAEGPDEIAVAIVAEILAIQRGGSAGFLREGDAPIHARATGVGRGA